MRSGFCGFIFLFVFSALLVASDAERSQFLRDADYALASTYGQLLSLLQSNAPEKAYGYGEDLLRLYPDAAIFTDVLFLQAWALYQMGESEQARIYSERFVQSGLQVFSHSMRGYRDADGDRFLWIEQKERAMRYVQGDSSAFDGLKRESIRPNYYYSSTFPGFIDNPEDYAPNQRQFLRFILGNTRSTGLGVGLQWGGWQEDRVSYAVSAMLYRHHQELELRLPLPVYSTVDHRFGLLLTPRVGLLRSDVDASINGAAGLTLSAGYFLRPAWLLAGYYSSALSWHTDDVLRQWELAIHRPLMKRIDLKIGLWNAAPMLGLILNRTECMYIFPENRFVFRTVIY